MDRWMDGWRVVNCHKLPGDCRFSISHFVALLKSGGMNNSGDRGGGGGGNRKKKMARNF